MGGTAFDLTTELCGVEHRSGVGALNRTQNAHLASVGVDGNRERVHVERDRAGGAIIAAVPDEGARFQQRGCLQFPFGARPALRDACVDCGTQFLGSLEEGSPRHHDARRAKSPSVVADKVGVRLRNPHSVNCCAERRSHNLGMHCCGAAAEVGGTHSGVDTAVGSERHGRLSEVPARRQGSDHRQSHAAAR